MSEDKRNDAHTDKGAGNDAGSNAESKPSNAGGAGSATSSKPAGSAQANKQAASKSASKPSKPGKQTQPEKPAESKAAESKAAESKADRPAGSADSGAKSERASASSKPTTPASSASATTPAAAGAGRVERPGAQPARSGGSSGSVPPSGGDGERDRGNSGGPALLVAIIALIVAIVAIIGAGWLWYRGEQKLASLDSRTQTVEQGMQSSVQKVVMPKLSKFDQRLQSLSSKISSSDAKQSQTLSTLQSSLKSLQDSLQATQSQTTELADQIQGSANSWDLNQIELLLRAANQRLQLYHDPQGARRALQLANDAIGRKGDPQLFEIRSEIVNEIAALRALPTPDIEGLSLSLAAVIKQVPGLPLASTVPGEYKQSAGNGQASGGGSGGAGKRNDQDNASDGGFNLDKFKSLFTQGWDHFKSSVGQALSGMLTIRREDGTQSALLPPDQVFFLNQNLQLELRTARLALMEHDTDAYRDSLASAKKWLGDYYDTDASSVSSMRKQLDQMSNAKLNWQTPDISKSLSMLRDVMSGQAGGSNAGGSGDEGGGAASDSGQSNSEQSNAGQSNTGQSDSGQSNAGQSKPGQSKPGQSDTEQPKPEQSGNDAGQGGQ